MNCQEADLGLPAEEVNQITFGANQNLEGICAQVFAAWRKGRRKGRRRVDMPLFNMKEHLLLDLFLEQSLPVEEKLLIASLLS